MGVLHLFSIKNVFYDKMDLRFFYFRATICSFAEQLSYKIHAKVTHTEVEVKANLEEKNM